MLSSVLSALQWTNVWGRCAICFCGISPLTKHLEAANTWDSHSVDDQELGEHPLVLQGSQFGCSHVARDPLLCRRDGLGSQHCSRACQVLRGCSFPRGPPEGCRGISQGPWLPPERVIQERGRKEHSILMASPWRSPHLPPPPKGTPWVWIPRAGIVGAILEAGSTLEPKLREAGSLPRVRAVRPRSDCCCGAAGSSPGRRGQR